jgi:hypothetical protein
LVVKVHPFYWLPAVVEFWSSALPAKSLAPVVTTLYLVLAASSVVDAPNGLSVAFRPSELGVTVTLVTWVVPLEVTLKSLKADLVIEVGLIFSEKVAATLVPHPMPVPVGVAVLTLGFMVSLCTMAYLYSSQLGVVVGLSGPRRW